MLRPYVWLICVAATTRDHIAAARARALTGQGLVEYALIIAVVAVVAVVVLTTLGGKIQQTLSDINGCLPAGSAAGACPTPAP
jgi:Flp pilus assembly pilin Flp